MLEEKIFKDYQEAMKNKDTLKSSTLSFLRAELINLATAKKKKNLEDSEVSGVIRRQIKARQEAIAQFKQGNRLDLAEKETKELEVLKAYLPEELNPEELKKIITETIATTGAQGLKDMGKVMKEVAVKVAGRADSKLVSDLVREILQSYA